MLRHIGLKNYATFVDEYGNETGFLHFFVVNSKKFKSHLPQHQQLPKEQLLCRSSRHNPLNHCRDISIKETFHCRGATTSMSASKTDQLMRKSSNDLAYEGAI